MNLAEFKLKYEEVPVKEYPNQVPVDVEVSVCVETYQHAEYIEECLDSILAQETNFNYEILLGEDASTDGTRDICIRYAKEHPTKIRLFLHHRENNIPINGNPSGLYNLLFNFHSANGKYIAICEGDDYWTSSFKLQKQLYFMEKNPKTSMTFHASNRVFPNGQTEPYPTNKLFHETGIIPKHKLLIKGGGTYATPSAMFRHNILDDSSLYPLASSMNSDFLLALLAIKNGDIGYLNTSMSMYRVNSVGSWSSKLDINQKIENNNTTIECIKKFDDITENKYRKVLRKSVIKYLYYKKHLFFYEKNHKINEDFLNDINKIGFLNTLRFLKSLLTIKYHKL